MPPSTMVAVAPIRPSSMVLRERAPEILVLHHRAIMIERQHVPAVEAEELEERADRELADRQHDGDDEEQDAERERHPAPRPELGDVRRIALAGDGRESCGRAAGATARSPAGTSAP